MAKRRSEKQITQENWDDELEHEEVGQFKIADETEIKNRVIRVAKRRLKPPTSEEGEKPVSVFSGFSLLSDKSSTIGSEGAAAAKPLFSFASNVSSVKSSPFSSLSVLTAPSLSLAKPNDQNKSTKFVKNLKDLNNAVLASILDQIDSGKVSVLTPIFKDYESFVAQLDEKDKNDNNISVGTASTDPIESELDWAFSDPVRSFGDIDDEGEEEFKHSAEADSIYSKSCKVFLKDEGDYKDRGVGTLYIKNAPDDKVQLIVRANTSVGQVLLNILLTSAIPAKRLKNNVALVCIPTPESDPKPRTVLVRVKTEEDAIELLDEISKHQKPSSTE